MKVLLGFNAQFVGKVEHVVKLKDNTTEEQVKAMFLDVLGVPFDENCYFQRVSDFADVGIVRENNVFLEGRGTE